MSFLVPAFLLGALAIGIPVYIHLTHREKKDVVPFPSIMFLRKIPYREVRRRRLRHILLLSLRSLAILLLTLAFSRPFFDTPPSQAATALGPREVVILIDNSVSMAYDSRLEAAKQEARSLISGLGPQDRTSIIVFSDTVELQNQPTEDKDALVSIVDTVGLSAGATRFAPAIKIAKRVLDDSGLSRRAVAMISDFQRIGWEDDQDAWLSTDTEFMPIQIGGQDPAENLTIADLALERERVAGRERLQASVRLTRQAPADADEVEAVVEIELSGRSLQKKEVLIGANQATTVNFEPFTIPDGTSRGVVRLNEDKLPIDDRFYFVLWPGQSIRVLLLRGPGREGRRSLFVQRALAIGERPSYEVELKGLSALTAADLRDRDVVVVADPPNLSETQNRLLDEFVDSGGGLIFIGGQNSRGIGGELIPAQVGKREDRSAELGGTLAYVDYNHPMFELFRQPRNGDFSTARFYRYLACEPKPEARVLARFDDGAAALIEAGELAEQAAKRGVVLFWASTLDGFWNDLSRQPIFLPFIHELIKYAAGHSAASSWQRVGDVADLGRYMELAERAQSEGGDAGIDLVVTTPAGERGPVDVSGDASARALLSVRELGFYELRRSGAGAIPVPMAVNPIVAESDLGVMDPEELASAVLSGSGRSVASEDRIATPGEREQRQSAWWYLLVVAFVLFAAETVISNRLSRAPA